FDADREVNAMAVTNRVNRVNGRRVLRRRQDSCRTAWETSWSSAKFGTSDGTELHVCDSAAGATGAPVTLIMLHGWTLDHTSWSPVLAELDLPVRVLRYDHRGHGESGPAPEGTATIDQLGDDLAELIEQRVPTGQIVLAGHSM